MDWNAIDVLLKHGHRIDAIKEHRRISSTNLHDAKTAIELRELQLGLRTKFMFEPMYGAKDRIGVWGPDGVKFLSAEEAYKIAQF